MSEQQKSPRVKMTGLWAGETKDGTRYLSGGNGSQRWSIWLNSFKEKESDPTHILYVEQAKKKEESSDQGPGF